MLVLQIFVYKLPKMDKFMRRKIHECHNLHSFWHAAILMVLLRMLPRQVQWTGNCNTDSTIIRQHGPRYAP
jgi:hypothetical protein